MATSYQMGKSYKSHKYLEPTKEQSKNYVDKPKMSEKQADKVAYEGSYASRRAKGEGRMSSDQMAAADMRVARARRKLRDAGK